MSDSIPSPKVTTETISNLLRTNIAPLSRREMAKLIADANNVTGGPVLDHVIATAVLELLNQELVRMVRYGDTVRYWLVRNKVKQEEENERP